MQNNIEKNLSQMGRFGKYGGQYVPETLMQTLIELSDAYTKYSLDAEFNAELQRLLNEYAGRPSRLYFAKKLSEALNGAKIYLKREDLNHTGSHKINNVLGQVLLAKRMGKSRIIAETGAGQHGVATATVSALLGLDCEIFMGEEDTKRQALNVYRMKLLGASVNVVKDGTRTLKDAINDAMREWTRRPLDTHYAIGSVMGPHPFPTMVRDFQSVISREAREQILAIEGKLPTAVIACVGGGSNAMGMFHHFVSDENVELIGCEAAGRGIDTAQHAASIARGRIGIFHGMKSIFCQDKAGQIAPVYSISAGLDYPGIGPEHANFYDSGRVKYTSITDTEAVYAFKFLSQVEGIIPAIESAHAVAYVMKIAPSLTPNDSIIVCLSGRGDKDVAQIARLSGEEVYE
ncbi:MAG: tryptophan synthase subunit beta [Christensenellaceae bacterium]|jgi:tryptophan synthase beta chain|nr:tryptophan synthase subunit beta [Christensenellaceae bacterium]